MQAIILCGGLATRLGAFTKTIPKVLLDIADRTVLNWQLDEMIVEAFPRGRDSFSIEQDVFPHVSNLWALRTDVNWIDIGVPERLAYARRHFRNGGFR